MINFLKLFFTNMVYFTLTIIGVLGAFWLWFYIPMVISQYIAPYIGLSEKTVGVLLIVGTPFVALCIVKTLVDMRK